MAFLRYSFIGALATATHYALLFGLVETRLLLPAPAAVSGALAGAVVAYLGNRTFTFTHTAPPRQTLPRFALVALGGAALNGLIVWAGTVGLAVHYLLAQGLATALVLGLTFLLNRAWTFA